MASVNVCRAASKATEARGPESLLGRDRMHVLLLSMHHGPVFAVRHGMQVLAHTFRGSSFRSLGGLEDERKVFARYRAIRKTERTYV